VRTRGSFRVGQVDDISWRYCALVQRANGYDYANGKAQGRAMCLHSSHP